MTSTYANIPPMAAAIPVDFNAKAPGTGAVETQSYNLPGPGAANTAPVEEKQLQRLMEQGYTRGLAQSISKSKQAFALRIWVVDNSGSMQTTDGHRIVETRKSQDVKMVPCSRWEEIRECVSYHINLAATTGSPTSFRLLNNPGANVGPQQFSVAETPERSPYDGQEALSIMRQVRPGGCTPLTEHIYEIHRAVTAMVPLLRESGQRVVVVIATDGLPTDPRGYGGESFQNEFVEALRMLEGLPIWLVIRLCTDEEAVVEFYNELDSVLELSIEVLDDFSGEAAEVYQENPWLNYALPLHRLREMGYHDRVFDMLDERLLTKSELRDFCALLFGEDNFDGVPDPSVDWLGFTQQIQRLMATEQRQWNPMKKRLTPWIDMSKLNQLYHRQDCCVIL